jgi:Terminase large subunit, T4likevirus-type, N-terminal
MPDIIFKPTDRQNSFISLPDTVFEALYGGAAGGGKTEILLNLPLIRKFYEHSKFKALILRRTFKELDREIIRRAHEYYPAAGGKYNKEDHSYSFPSGAFVDFGHAEHEADIRKYDTAQYNLIIFDELTSFTEFQYVYLSASRCRSSSVDLPAIVRSGTNPDGQGASWVKKRFIDPCPSGNKIVIDKISNNKRIFIPSRIQDNPYLLESDPNYVNRLQLLPEREKAAKLYGSWDVILGQAFEEFRLDPYSDEPENAKHVIKPFEIPSSWPSVCAGDWGWNAKFFSLKAHLAPNKRVYITKEYSAKKTYIAIAATEIAKYLYSNSRYFFLDPSAWQHRGEPQTLNELFAKYSGIVPMKADNDRVSGCALIHDYLRWETIPVYAQSSANYDDELAQKILRISGMEGYNKYLDSFKDPEIEGNLPMLQIFDTCTELIECISQCMISEDKPNDIAEFDGDDPYDTLRYLLKGVIYLQSKMNPLEVKKNELTEQFQNGEVEINSFYRKMEYLESQQGNSSKTIRMH